MPASSQQSSLLARSADVVTSEGLEIQDESSDGATATAADQSMEATMTAVSDAKKKGEPIFSLPADIAEPSNLKQESPASLAPSERMGSRHFTLASVELEDLAAAEAAAAQPNKADQRSSLAAPSASAIQEEDLPDADAEAPKSSQTHAGVAAEDRHDHSSSSTGIWDSPVKSDEPARRGSARFVDASVSKISDPWAASLAQKEGPELKVAAAIVARKKVEKEIAQNELHLVSARKAVKLQTRVEAKAAASVREVEAKLRTAVMDNSVAQQEAADMRSTLKGAESDKIKLQSSLHGGLLETRLGVGEEAADLNLAALLMAKRKAEDDATRAASVLESAKEAVQRQMEVEEKAVLRVQEALQKVVSITTANKVAHQEAQDLANILYGAEAERAEARSDVMDAAGGQNAVGLSAGLRKLGQLDGLRAALGEDKADELDDGGSKVLQVPQEAN